MLNRGQRDEIQRLRATIHDLKDAPVRGNAWTSWYGSVCEFITRTYGLESTEFAEFQAIRFEPMGAFQSAEDALQSIGIPMQIAEEHYYLERLSEADEYLLSLRWTHLSTPSAMESGQRATVSVSILSVSLTSQDVRFD
jgi:hypothetical protein